MHSIYVVTVYKVYLLIPIDIKTGSLLRPHMLCPKYLMLMHLCLAIKTNSLLRQLKCFQSQRWSCYLNFTIINDAGILINVVAWTLSCARPLIPNDGLQKSQTFYRWLCPQIGLLLPMGLCNYITMQMRFWARFWFRIFIVHIKPYLSSLYNKMAANWVIKSYLGKYMVPGCIGNYITSGL